MSLDNRFYREPQAADNEDLRYDEDGLHIYWFDPVEGCWVAFRRVDCVGEEELPERRLPRPGCGPARDTEKPEWEYTWEGPDWCLEVDRVWDTVQECENAPESRWARQEQGQIARRRKAGPWVQVKQEGADQ